jgi:hypothetical protein
VQASVVASSLVVRFEESSWPFQLNLREGTASIAVDGRVYEVRPLTWREKTRLARFAHLGQEFIQARFLEACLGGPDNYPATGSSQAVLEALAMWINLPSEDVYGLPLEQNTLANVTIELCRSLGVGPMAIGELSAPEAEMLWQNLDHAMYEDESSRFPARAQSKQINASPLAAERRFNTWLADEHQFENKIIIIPDPVHPRMDAPQFSSEQPDLRPNVQFEDQSEDQVETHSLLQQAVKPEPAAFSESVSSEAKPAVFSESLSSEAKKPDLPVDHKTTSREQGTRARFRFSLDTPTPKAQNASTLRSEVGTPQRSSLQPSEQAQTRAQATNRVEADPRSLSHAVTTAQRGASANQEWGESKTAATATVDTASAPISYPVRNLPDRLPNRMVRSTDSSAPVLEVLKNPDDSEVRAYAGDASDSVNASDMDISAMLFSPSLSVVQSGSAVTQPAALQSIQLVESESVIDTDPFLQAEQMEWMLDEFCERLAEAAADLGIMEEV